MATTKTPQQQAASIEAQLQLCRRALAAAWVVWEPVLRTERSHDVDDLARCVAAAMSAASTEAELRAATSAWKSLPQHTSPPPYAGHFYGAVHTLLLARSTEDIAARDKQLRQCRRFAPSRPTAQSSGWQR